jgi:hypothetical protein
MTLNFALDDEQEACALEPHAEAMGQESIPAEAGAEAEGETNEARTDRPDADEGNQTGADAPPVEDR